MERGGEIWGEMVRDGERWRKTERVGEGGKGQQLGDELKELSELLL